MSLTGMSYRPRKTNQHQCRVCGNIFIATRFDARYCGPTCRQAISRSQRGLVSLAVNVVATNAPILSHKLSQVSPPATVSAEPLPTYADMAPPAAVASQNSTSNSVTPPKQKVTNVSLKKSVTVTDKSRIVSQNSVDPRKSVTAKATRPTGTKSVTKKRLVASSAKAKPLARSKPKSKGKKK